MKPINWRGFHAIFRKEIITYFKRAESYRGTLAMALNFGIVAPLGLMLMFRFVNVNHELLNLLIEGAHKSGVPSPFHTQPLEALWSIFNINFLPMLLILPFLTAISVAVPSFVGEREEGTMEGLLYTPISNMGLLSAKVISATLFALVFSEMGVLGYYITVQIAAKLIFGVTFLSFSKWAITILFIIPMFSMMGVIVVVFISLRAKSSSRAGNIAGLLILPLVGLFYTQFAGFLVLNDGILLLIALGVLIFNLIALHFVAKFDRELLLLGRPKKFKIT